MRSIIRRETTPAGEHIHLGDIKLTFLDDCGGNIAGADGRVGCRYILVKRQGVHSQVLHGVITEIVIHILI